MQILNNPCLIIAAGCAGSGKTTIGKELAKQLGFVFVDKDTATREYTDFILTELGSFEGDKESELYKTHILPIEYRVTFRICKDILDSGRSVIVAIPFISQIKDWSNWLAIKESAGIGSNVKTLFLWIEHNIEAERKNIIRRGAIRDTYKIQHRDEYAKSVENIHPAAEYNAYVYVNDRDIRSSGILDGIREWVTDDITNQKESEGV